jgi:hypothetical protein
MNGNTSTQDGNQRKHVREHVLVNAAIQMMNGESPELTPSAQAHLEKKHKKNRRKINENINKL